jgi:hypothetical protein
MKQMDGVERRDVDRMSHLNAMRHFSFDPFATIPREEATVGALRRRAAGHDVSIRSRSAVRAHGGSTMAADLSKLAQGR